MSSSNNLQQPPAGPTLWTDRDPMRSSFRVDKQRFPVSSCGLCHAGRSMPRRRREKSRGCCRRESSARSLNSLMRARAMGFCHSSIRLQLGQTMQAQMQTPPTTPTGSMSAQAPLWAPERCNAKRIDSLKTQHEVQDEVAPNHWQSERHMPERRAMVQRILQLSQGRSKTDVDPQRAVLLAKRIELALYSRAGSLTEYCNLATLRRRLQGLVASSVHEAAASETVMRRKRRVVSRNLLHVTRTTKRRRGSGVSTLSDASIFDLIGEDCTRLVFSFLDGKEAMRCRAVNRFAAAFLPSCVRSITVEVAQLTRGMAHNSSMLQMTNLQQLLVHKAGALSMMPTAARVGSATTPLYAWGCAELPTNQANDGESAVLALAGALSAGAFPSLKKLQLISVFVNTTSRNGLRALCGALEAGCCPLLEDLLLAGNSLADIGAYDVACLLQSAQVPRLSRLDLRRNFIGETGLRAVLAALAQTQQHSSPPLQVLCMGGNLVTDNCVNELQRLLAGTSCPSLRFLGLEDNFLSAEGVQLVLETAAVNNTPSTRAHRVSCDRGAPTSA